METAKLVIFSHLSDAQELIGYSDGLEASKRINFAKYVILQTSGDLNTLIDPIKMYEDFLTFKK